MKKVTIKDVAREAGVSISTVSNALNDVDVLLPETKKRILEVAKRMNYIPNLNGRNLKATETKAIGLFVSSMRGDFYGTLADTMYWECVKYGYDLNVYITHKNTTIITNILGRRVDAAAILYEGVTKDTEEQLVNSGVPVVFLDREITGENTSSVLFDSFAEGEQAARYLVGLGNKSFGHIYGVEGNYDSRLRYEGFVHGLAEAGFSMDKENAILGRYEQAPAYEAVKEFIASGKKVPDAFFAANDLSALGCVEALQDGGYKVPEQVNVIGCDDIAISSLVTPKLTTIRTSFEKMGVITVRQIMKLLQEKSEGVIEKIEGKLIERETCATR